MQPDAVAPGVIFDGDDTLWRTQEFYDMAKMKFLNKIEQIGFVRTEASEIFEKQDAVNVPVMGFSRQRFPTSMVMTYQALCLRYNQSTSDLIKEELEDIGASVFLQKPKLIEGAEEVLGLLRTDYQLILLTKGDREIQERKVAELRMRQMVDAVYIVDFKNDLELELVIAEQRLNKEKSWMVGNSLRSDIVPAIRVGLRAIWIPNPTWSYEDHALTAPPGVRIADSLMNAALIILGR